MRFALILTLVWALFLSAPAWAQQTVATNVQGSVQLQQSLGAITRTTQVADVKLAGTARRIAGSDDETGTVVLEALATGETRTQFSFPSGQLSEARANTAKGPAGTWKGPDGKAHALSQHNLLTDSSWFFPGLTLTKLLTAQDSIITLVGQESRDGASVTHLNAIQQFADAPAEMAAVLQRLSRMDIFLDPTTQLPLALAFNQHPDDDAGLDMPAEIRFSDYRAVNGVEVPFHIQRFLNNNLILDIQLQTATLNSGLTAKALAIQ